MSQVSATQQQSADAVRPFHISFSDAVLADLRSRINATKWPEAESVPDATQGVQLKTIQEAARYWANDYDWRKCEAKLNSLPNFITEIDGLDIHFIHVRSKHENALPLIITHGWPGSVIEMLKVIDPLTNPTAHGAAAADAFHLVIPSMAGYGFSGKPTRPGWDAPRMARAWVTLMKRLGYDKFVAQGGDWGALVVDSMGAQAAPELLGIHTNMPGAIPDDIQAAVNKGTPPAGLADDERRAFDRLVRVFSKGVGYAYQMGLRPQTLYGIVDSPVGLAAYIFDHDAWSYAHIAELFAGGTFGDISRDDILDNVTLYWLTNTGISSAKLYWENKLTFFGPKGVSVPVAVSAFPEELYQLPRNWAEKAYPKLIYYNKVEKGGHFAAWEQPQLFSEEVRAGFRPLRK
jgi:pimeloyl-ACP methyl ester carboxylesterase